ncbi:MAG: DoxX family protein [Anaerolineales bacterium]|nr:DoxX family protein [Anaerolineales bacterium]
MDWLLWAVQLGLAVVFGQSGLRKLLRTDAQTRAVYWVGRTPVGVVRGLGALELLGVAGLLLPVLTGLWPWLTPAAALGLAGLMVGAGVVNLRLRRRRLVAANAVLLALAAFVAYGRFVLVPA